MRYRFLFAVAGIAVFAVVALAVYAQKPASTWNAPRTPWGDPDLQGTFSFHTITPLERPKEFEGKEYLTDQEAAALEKAAKDAETDEARFDDADRDVAAAYNDFWWDRALNVVETHRTSLIVDPSDGKIPALTPEAQKRAQLEPSHRPLRATGGFQGGVGGDSWFDRSLWERCITQGLPRISSAAYNSNIEITQAPGNVVILYEMIHEARVIPLDGRAHVGKNIRQYLGDSRGYWEGDTLVVDTTNFGSKTNFRGSTDNLHMIERFTRAGPATINYEVTFDDPTTWTRSWTAATHWKQIPSRIYEYA